MSRVSQNPTSPVERMIALPSGFTVVTRLSETQMLIETYRINVGSDFAEPQTEIVYRVVVAPEAVDSAVAEDAADLASLCRVVAS